MPENPFMPPLETPEWSISAEELAEIDKGSGYQPPEKEPLALSPEQKPRDPALVAQARIVANRHTNEFLLDILPIGRSEQSVAATQRLFGEGEMRMELERRTTEELFRLMETPGMTKEKIRAGLLTYLAEELERVRAEYANRQ